MADLVKLGITEGGYLEGSRLLRNVETESSRANERAPRKPEHHGDRTRPAIAGVLVEQIGVEHSPR